MIYLQVSKSFVKDIQPLEMNTIHLIIRYEHNT